MNRLYLRPEQLARAAGASMGAAQRWCEPVNDAMRAFGVDTPQRAAAFLAHVSHASDGLTRVREEWTATDVQRRYEGWRALGNIEPGDGRRYKRRGLLPVAGRAGYRACRDGLRAALPGVRVPDIEAHPAYLEWPRWAAYSAGWRWQSSGFNELSDAGSDADFVLTSKILWGSGAAVDELRELWASAMAALGA